MKFGRDFFKIMGLIIQIARFFAGLFGDEEDQQAVADSRQRSASDNPEEIA